MSQRVPGRVGERTGNRRRLFRIEYLLLAVILGIAGVKFFQKIQEVRQLAVQEHALQVQNNKIAQQNQALQQSIKYYHSEQYLQSSARQYFGYINPGETVVQVKPVTPHYVPVRSTPVVQVPPQPAWSQWWHTFFS